MTGHLSPDRADIVSLSGHRVTEVYRSPDITGHRARSTVHRQPDPFHRSPSTVHGVTETGHRSPSTVHRIADTGHRTYGVPDPVRSERTEFVDRPPDLDLHGVFRHRTNSLEYRTPPDFLSRMGPWGDPAHFGPTPGYSGPNIERLGLDFVPEYGPRLRIEDYYSSCRESRVERGPLSYRYGYERFPPDLGHYDRHVPERAFPPRRTRQPSATVSRRDSPSPPSRSSRNVTTEGHASARRLSVSSPTRPESIPESRSRSVSPDDVLSIRAPEDDPLLTECDEEASTKEQERPKENRPSFSLSGAFDGLFSLRRIVPNLQSHLPRVPVV